MPNYKLIIFDFDGTLCATHEAILFCIKKAYQVLGKTVPEQELTDSIIREGLGMNGTFKTLTKGIPADELQRLLDTYEAIYLKEGETKSTPFSKAAQVLQTLYTAGFILTIVSNKAIAAVELALDYFALKHYISIVVGDTKTLRKKPDPMAYTDFIKKKFPTINPREILMIGDTPADILFAKNIGADACWAEYGYGDAKTCHALNPTYTIRHLTDILTILL